MAITVSHHLVRPELLQLTSSLVSCSHSFTACRELSERPSLPDFPVYDSISATPYLCDLLYFSSWPISLNIYIIGSFVYYLSLLWEYASFRVETKAFTVLSRLQEQCLEQDKWWIMWRLVNSPCFPDLTACLKFLFILLLTEQSITWVVP